MIIMIKAVMTASSKMATLDEGGFAFVIIRCENEADILRVVEGYRHKRQRVKAQYLSKNQTKASAAPKEPEYELNMYEVSGDAIVEFGSSQQIERSFNDQLRKKLSTSINDQRHQLIYIRNIFDLVGGEGRNTEQRIYLNLLKDIGIAKQRGKSKTLIAIASLEGTNCPELEAYSYILDIPHLENQEIQEIITDSCRLNTGNPELVLLPSLLNELTEAFKGFREDNIRSTIEITYAQHENPLQNKAGVLFAQIKDTKKQLLKKTGGLEWIDVDDEESGGLLNLKEWIKQKEVLFTYFAAAKIHDITTPKGVLVSGIPGTGKSLMAKATARTLKVPLIKMDMGSLMGKYLGESEANLTRAIRLAEAISPCVLWIDELEKSFAGVGGSSDNNQTIMRSFSTFLTWLQEKTKPCFVFATANKIDKLPPEFLRKGRFDEKFYTFMPSFRECTEILQKRLEKKRKCFSLYSESIVNKVIWDLLEVASENRKYLIGADMASIVDSAFEQLFVEKFWELSEAQKSQATNKRLLTFSCSEITEALIGELRKTRTYGETNLRSIGEYWLDMYKNRFREASASSGDTLDYDDFKAETGEFKSLFEESKNYEEHLEGLLREAAERKLYDRGLKISLAIEIKRIFSLKP
jgi:SpoVK/Ycf46/Vps4 family AAA+-type ATPase